MYSGLTQALAELSPLPRIVWEHDHRQEPTPIQASYQSEEDLIRSIPLIARVDEEDGDGSPIFVLCVSHAKAFTKTLPATTTRPSASTRTLK